MVGDGRRGRKRRRIRRPPVPQPPVLPGVPAAFGLLFVALYFSKLFDELRPDAEGSLPAARSTLPPRDLILYWGLYWLLGFALCGWASRRLARKLPLIVFVGYFHRPLVFSAGLAYQAIFNGAPILGVNGGAFAASAVPFVVALFRDGLLTSMRLGLAWPIGIVFAHGLTELFELMT